MRIFVPQQFDGIISGAHHKTTVLYDTVNVDILGNSRGKACGVTIEMTPYRAMSLAIDLIHASDKSGKQLQAQTKSVLKRLSKKYLKEPS